MPASALLGPDTKALTQVSRRAEAVGGCLRFAVITAAILSVTLLSESFRRLWFGDLREAIHGLTGNELHTEVLVLMGVGAAALIAWRRRANEGLALAALLFLSAAVVLSQSQVAMLTGESAVTLRPSWAAVFILLLVLLVPGSLIYNFSLLFFTSALTPVMVGLWLVTPHPASPGRPRFMHTKQVLLRRMLVSMEPTWTCAVVGAALAIQRDRERRRWKALADELQTARGRLSKLGAYTLERKLGQGGMGEVWQATHETLARPAAIKLVNPKFLDSMADSPEGMERLLLRFEQEAKITARLTSPHTVQVYDYGETDDGRIFYVMELLHGVDLDKLIRARGPQPPERVAGWMLEICDSLAEAHSYGLVHRDIKPANLILSRQGLRREVIKVVDFGLAAGRSAALLTTPRGSTDTITGSPHFMSPEQIRDAEVDGRSDLYSLGCVAWRLLTGREVFHPAEEAEVLQRHLETSPPSLGEACGKSVDPLFTNLIESLLAKRPEERPQTAEAVAAEIRALGWATPDTPLLTPDLIALDADYAAGGTVVLVRTKQT